MSRNLLASSYTFLLPSAIVIMSSLVKFTKRFFFFATLISTKLCVLLISINIEISLFLRVLGSIFPVIATRKILRHELMHVAPDKYFHIGLVSSMWKSSGLRSFTLVK
jgi:hypothetical protein